MTNDATVKVIDSEAIEMGKAHPMYEQAIRYYELGLCVVPARLGKLKIPACIKDHPQFGGWKQWQTERPDPATLASWFSLLPHDDTIGLGIITGPISGVMVVDVDTVEGKDNPVLTQFQSWFSHAPMVVSPSGGRHYYYEYHTDWDYSTSASVVADHVDIRGRGGFVVLPPSVHPTTGKRYYWMLGRDLTDSNRPQPLPDELAARIQSASKPTAAKTPSPSNPPASSLAEIIAGDPIPQGQRNDALTSILGRLSAYTGDKVEIATALHTANQTRCKPPLPDAEIDYMLSSHMDWQPTGDSAYVERKERQKEIIKVMNKGNEDRLDAMVETAKDDASAKKQWTTVTDDDAYAAIQGTDIEPIVDVLSSPLVPSIPITITLPKALVMVGSMLCEDNRQPDAIGADRLTLRIQTAEGQGCNVYALIIAPTGVGKSAGGIMERTMFKRQKLIGNGGSSEGLADSLGNDGGMPTGILSISEFRPYMNPERWEYRAGELFTDVWVQGWFRRRLSTKMRESQFCYPSIICQVQPDVICKAPQEMIDSGFMGRMIVTRTERDCIREPRVTTVSRQPLEDALTRYGKVQGVVYVQQGYSRGLLEDAHEYGCTGGYERICNEYYPKLAVMLSRSTTPSDDAWDRAETLCRWFLQYQRETMLMISGAYTPEEKHLKWQTLIMDGIRACVENGKRPNRRNITRYRKQLEGATPLQWDNALSTLIDNGRVEEHNANPMDKRTKPFYTILED